MEPMIASHIARGAGDTEAKRILYIALPNGCYYTDAHDV